MNSSLFLPTVSGGGGREGLGVLKRRQQTPWASSNLFPLRREPILFGGPSSPFIRVPLLYD